MKTSFLSLAVLAGLSLASVAETRTWTSADDSSKTFQGEFVSLKGDTVTIKRGDGKALSFPQSKLSAEDRDYIREKAAAEPSAAADAEKTSDAKPVAKGEESPMAKALKGKTVKLEGKRFRKFDLAAAKQPEYYLIYWGASWCGPCQAAAPDLVKLYDEKLASSSKVELVHFSRDDAQAGMKSFMGDHNMKFPAVEKADGSRIKILQELQPSAIPSYKLVDAEGKLIAEGHEAKQKAAELAKDSKNTASAD